MNDYPTAAEIDAARGTLARLRNFANGPGVPMALTWSALSDALAILDNLTDVPGLAQPEPEPEPKPTAAQVLLRAFERAKIDSVEESILWAAKCYAEAHPEWFVNWHEFEWTTSALVDAGNKASAAGDETADSLLLAAARVAGSHPHLFGGAS